MVLSKQGYEVESYKKSVRRLYEQLEYNIRDTKDPDRKQDLFILQKDVKCLMEYRF